MPKITIEITEAQEAKIVDSLLRRRDFLIDGGRVSDGEKMVFLKSIQINFYESESAERIADSMRRAAAKAKN